MIRIKKIVLNSCLLLIIAMLVGCTGASRTPVSTDSDRPDWWDQVPKGQAQFPILTHYWVADPVGCFSQDAKEYAFKIFDALSSAEIAQVAVVCQVGVTESDGGPNIWLRNWGRNQKVGTAKEDRGIVYLIRPDAAPEKNRVFVQKSQYMYWFGEISWDPILEITAKYANINRFDEALRTIARMTDEVLRKEASEYKGVLMTPTPNP